jgi:hypothetical protein
MVVLTEAMRQLQLKMDQVRKRSCIVQPGQAVGTVGFVGYGRMAALKKKCK